LHQRDLRSKAVTEATKIFPLRDKEVGCTRQHVPRSDPGMYFTNSMSS